MEDPKTEYSTEIIGDYCYYLFDDRKLDKQCGLWIPEILDVMPSRFETGNTDVEEITTY